MISIDIFSGSLKNQTIRTLIAIVILMIADLIYYFFTGGILSGTKFYKGEFPLVPYLITWIVLGILFGTIEFKNKTENPELNPEGTIIPDSITFGIIIGIIVYSILTTWLYYVNGSFSIAFMNLCFGIISCVFASMFTHFIAINKKLYN